MSKLPVNYSPTALCAECQSELLIGADKKTKAGAQVCQACACAYYVLCVGCEYIIPQDESLTRGEAIFCSECYVSPPIADGAASLDQSGIESLIAEYTALHAEEKRIGTRMEEIKELLKDVAATQPRVSGAVTLRAGDAAVKCSFRTTLRCDPEVLEKLEQTLDQNEFGELFERKVTDSPHKERVQEFLDTTDGGHEAARELLRAAVRETESATLTVVPARKS